MNAYKVELLVLDFDEIGEEEIKSVLETTNYPNWCISPEVKKITCRDIGEWTDDHPLNSEDTCDQEYIEIFGT